MVTNLMEFLAKMMLDSALETHHSAGGEVKLSVRNMLITFNHEMQQALWEDRCGDEHFVGGMDVNQSTASAC